MLAFIINSDRMEKGESPISICKIQGSFDSLLVDLMVEIDYIYGALKENSEKLANDFQRILTDVLSEKDNPVWNGKAYEIAREEAEEAGADENTFRNHLLQVDTEEFKKQMDELMKGGEQE